MAALDATDIKLLQALQEDASRAAAEIAAMVGISPSTCGTRIKKLTREKLDMRAQFFVKVSVVQSDPSYIESFVERMKAAPEVVECHVLLGAFDFLLRVVTPDLRTYEQFYFNTLCGIPGVREATTSVSISEIKMTTALPLPRA